MRAIWIAEVVVLCLCPGLCMAQTWTFDRDDEIQGWRTGMRGFFLGGGNYRNLRVEDGVLKISLVEGRSTGQEKYYGVRLLSPELNREAELFDRLKVRVRVDRGIVPNWSVTLHWHTTAIPALDLDRSTIEVQKNTQISRHNLGGLTTEWQELEFDEFADTPWREYLWRGCGWEWRRGSGDQRRCVCGDARE